MATPMLTHGNLIYAQYISLGPFTCSRKDEGLTSGSRTAAAVGTSAFMKSLTILRLNFIQLIEYKLGFFGCVKHWKFLFLVRDKSIFAVERGRREKAPF